MCAQKLSFDYAHILHTVRSDNGRIIEIPYLYRLDRKEIGTEIIVKINREGYLQ